MISGIRFIRYQGTNPQYNGMNVPMFTVSIFGSFYQ